MQSILINKNILINIDMCDNKYNINMLYLLNNYSIIYIGITSDIYLEGKIRSYIPRSYYWILENK
jgi:hypothetical protein